jgi:small subunit ribosomal protein S9
MAEQYHEGVGRRKRATARVRIHLNGSGNAVVNDKPLEEYFPRSGDALIALSPLDTTNNRGRFDVTVVVKGGGITGQSEAVTMGLARALVKFDEELRSSLRKAGMLSRDPREKERKKPGLKRARKAPTYTKR